MDGGTFHTFSTKQIINKTRNATHKKRKHLDLWSELFGRSVLATQEMTTPIAVCHVCVRSTLNPRPPTTPSWWLGMHGASGLYLDHCPGQAGRQDSLWHTASTVSPTLHYYLSVCSQLSCLGYQTTQHRVCELTLYLRWRGRITLQKQGEIHTNAFVLYIQPNSNTTVPTIQPQKMQASATGIGSS